MRALLFYLSLPLIAGIGLWRPFWGLAIYLSANIIRPEMLFWGGNTGALIFKVSIGSALLGFLFSNQDKTEPFAVRELWLVLWISLAGSASLILTDLSPAPKAWNYVGELYKLLIICWLLLGVIQKKQQALQLIDILLLMAMLLSLWGWDQSFRGNARLEGLGGESFGDSNGVAAFGVLFLPLAVHKLFTAKKNWQKIFGLDAAILIAGMIVFTNSRGGLVGLVAASLYLLLISRKRIWLGICYFLVLLAIVPLLSDDYIARLSTIQSSNPEQEYSAGSRQVLWHAGWLMFKDNPIFGVGLLHFAPAKLPYRTQLTGKFDDDLLDYTFDPGKVGHSTWFGQVLPEGGLFFAIPYFWLIMGFFWRTRRLRWAARPASEEIRPLYDALIGLEAGLFGYCVSISFIDALFLPFLTIHIMLGVQLIRIIEKSNENITT